MNRLHQRPSLGPVARAIAVLAAAATLAPSLVRAAQVDVSSVPLSAAMAQVKPNIMFILDDSGSMGNTYMPEEAAVGSAGAFQNYGYWSTQCNGLAFNPALAYAPPVRADGTSFPDVSFNAAPDNGFQAGSATTSLAGSFYYAYQPYSGGPAAMSWAYNTDGTVNTTTVFYRECTLSTSLASSRFIKYTVDNSSDAVTRQRFANWYSYYRSRRSLMRTAVGHAFKTLGASYRIGFTAISDSGVTGSSFLDVNDFIDDAATSFTQRSRFYELLYSTETAEGFTPLRASLSKVGRYFAKKVPGQTVDPMQYSCQRNYALLSTDGYWNTGLSGYPGLETGSYGPLQLDGGTRVGQQDGTEAPPMRDSAGGDSNSLADVAQYYWRTDLRPDMADNVPTNANDPASHQHLNTFTVGLGVRGTLSYDRNYLTQPTGDFASLRAGSKSWPVPTGTLNPSSGGDATHIDDLWHAAVNGRGQYFSATSPESLSDAISTTLSQISKDAGSGAAAAASSLTPVTGDNWVFLPSYSNTPSWQGELRAYQFTTDPTTNALIPPDTSDGKELWSARSRLDSRTATRRVLFGNAAGTLADFTYSNLKAAGYTTEFDTLCPSRLSQCSRLTATATAKATGDNLVKFLAGDTSLYMSATSTDNQVFRTRSSRLGDFINASPVYVAKPPFKYADAGYAQFVIAQAQRRKMVYAPSNDGMLHAFQVGEGAGDPTGGDELWAFVPRGVMSRLWHLADASYDSNHLYLLDATPTIGDVFDGSQWRSILVAGMGAGGHGYFALDITDPVNPKLLWEFTDTNLGLTFGNPVITKDASGTWVVAFTSGINNVGDGRGRLYIVNAITGQTRASNGQIVTSAGDTSTPSNLGRLNAWVPNDTDNTALRFYAGDMLGNLWRFDHDDRVAPSGAEATLLGQALAPDGSPQPITSKPVLSEITVNGGTPVAIVSFGTGRLLSISDLRNTTMQTIYSVKDALGASSLGPFRSTGAKLVREELGPSRQLNQGVAVDWTAQNGWYVDLNVSAGERVSLDGVPLAADILAFASIVPNADPCGSGGQSYLYQFQLTTGALRDVEASSSLIVGVNRVMDNKGQVSAFFTRRDQTTRLKASGSGVNPRSTTVRRTAWRELN